MRTTTMEQLDKQGRVKMDALTRKLRVIHWLTDYKPTVKNIGNKKCVELTHKNGLSKFMFVKPNGQQLHNELDNFLKRKLKDLSPKSVNKFV